MATALESASLVMVPCGYEDGTLGSLQPTDGSGDFTFTRGSNLSATRVNAAGNIEKGYENLLLQSNSFSNATWAKSSVSVTSGQSGYDGTNDAWLLSKSASNAYINQSNITNGVQTFSIYAKANESNFLYVRIYSDSPRVYFDLINGVATNSGPVISSSMEDVGDGWYRCSFSTNLTGANFLRIYPAEAAFDSSATTGSIYIQDAMLNQGLVAYPYIETTTTSAQGGILEYTPRIDYLSGPNGSLLLEPSRANLITQSEYLTGTSATSNFNQITSPEGLDNGVLLIENTATTSHGFVRATIIPTNANPVDYTISIFAKKKEREYINFSFYSDGTTTTSGYFNLINGTTNGDALTHKIEDYENGWYRCSYTQSVTQSTGGYNFARVQIGENTSAFYYQGDGTSGLYFYGLQLEQGSYPTSYIPTYGTSVTRAADILGNSNNISGLFNDNQGTFYFQTESTIFKGLSINSSFLGLTESSSGNYFRFRGKDTNILTQSIGFGSNINFNTSGATLTRYLYKWDGTNAKLFVDGVERGSVSQTATFNPDLFKLGFNSTFVSNTKQLLLFPAALSDADCITLTTL